MMIQQIDSQDLSGCPGREWLLAMSVGRLCGEERDAVERHLQGCDSCLAELQSVDDGSDPLIAELRGPADLGASDEDILRKPSRLDGLDSGLGRSERSGDSRAGVSSDRPVPERLGDYQLGEILGRGGMGIVYRAWHTRLGQVRALKVLRPERAGDRRAIERFQREMTILGGLEHPNLVRAFDAREEAGVIFLVMEFVEGLDLSRLLERRGPLPVADSCETVRQAAVGLEYAHRTHGLVHRDIKPSNLMITPTGCVKVLDLGISHVKPAASEGPGPAETPLTHVDERVGTYDYMAPEQWLMSRDADIRADVYGLGCTLYELLAGRAPYARSEWETRQEKMLAHALVSPPPIRELRPEVPDALAAIIERMLAKSRRDRYATPADVARALKPFTTGHDLPALLPPDQFVPTTAVVAEPFVADRTGSEGAQPAPRWWVPQWDWSHPPTFSKPIAVPAILALVTVLLLAQTIWNRWQRRDPDPAPVRGNLQKTPVPSRAAAVRTGDLVPATLTVRLYRLGPGPDDLKELGRIGDPRDGPQGAAVEDLRIVVEASFAEPLFPYLIAVNPDGTCEPQFPQQGSDASVRKEFEYPSGDDYLSLEDGLLGLILLGSRRPLSAAEAMGTIRVNAEAWRQATTGTPWLFDGERCEPLVRDRGGGFGKVSHGLKPFTDLCMSVSTRPEIAAVRAVAFPVKPAPKKP
jgi:serine/threonine protein kinase